MPASSRQFESADAARAGFDRTREVLSGGVLVNQTGGDGGGATGSGPTRAFTSLADERS